jgi:stress response protein SCP2
MLFARIFRENGGWSFQAVGKGYKTDSFVELMREFVDFES